MDAPDTRNVDEPVEKEKVEGEGDEGTMDEGAQGAERVEVEDTEDNSVEHSESPRALQSLLREWIASEVVMLLHSCMPTTKLHPAWRESKSGDKPVKDE